MAEGSNTTTDKALDVPQPPPPYMAQNQPSQPQPQPQPQGPVYMQQPHPGAVPYAQPQGPVYMQQPNPGAVGYYPQAHPGMPQMVVGAQVIQYRAPKHDYVPQNFWVLSILTIIFCGIFSPISLIFSIPALFFARKSQLSARSGSIKLARSQGMMAAYLNITAIVFALVLAMILTGVVVGLYSRVYIENQCFKRAEDRYGPLPVLNDDFAPYDYNYRNGRYYC